MTLIPRFFVDSENSLSPSAIDWPTSTASFPTPPHPSSSRLFRLHFAPLFLPSNARNDNQPAVALESIDFWSEFLFCCTNWHQRASYSIGNFIPGPSVEYDFLFLELLDFEIKSQFRVPTIFNLGYSSQFWNWHIWLVPSVTFFFLPGQPPHPQQRQPQQTPTHHGR